MSFFDIGAYHPVVMHLPIACMVLAFISAVISTIFSKKTLLMDVSVKRVAFYLTHILIVLTGITLIPTVLTGIYAADSFPATDKAVEHHRYLAYFTLIFTLAHTLIRIHYLWIRRHFAGIAVRHRLLLLTTLNLIFIAWTADNGGLVTRGKTPFQSLEDEEIAEAINYRLKRIMAERKALVAEEQVDQQSQENTSSEEKRI